MSSLLGLHLTDRCQLDCQHCLRDPARKARDLDVDLAARVIAEAQEVYGVQRVSLTGGEPTLHPHFDRIVGLIAERSLQWDMVSNGRAFPTVLGRLDREPKRVDQLRLVKFSLDGAEERTHDAIREKGSFQEVLAATRACTARGVSFGIQMAVHARNERELESLGVLAYQLGAARVSYALTQATGTHHDEALFLPASEWRRVRARIDRLASALGIPIALPEGHYDTTGSTCDALRGETLHVDVDGRLTLCCQHSQIPSTTPGEDVAGDLHQMSLAQARPALQGIIDRTQESLALPLDPAEAEWEHFTCNRCLANHGRPHWTDAGAAGATAQRERWRGVWAPGPHRHASHSTSAPTPERHRLPLVRQ